ncbi:MAG: tRNA pseudouridine(55) synthase TruB [Pseudomonadota bacterium]
MARRKKGRAISGWLVLDKPYGLGSTQAVGKAKWLYQARKAGHAGTLDPLASGLLPIALGEATKTVNYIMNGAKTYRFTVAWGEQRSTDDREGAVMASSDRRPARSDIEALLPEFTGDISQVPPAFSAIKVDGERAYDLARDGEEVVLQARDITIDRLAIVECDADSCTLEADCSKGTYVRAIARDLGERLGCYGHVSALRRTAVGGFTEDDMIELQELTDLEGDLNALDEQLLSTMDALESLTEISVSEGDAVRIRSGNPVLLRGRDAPLLADDVFATCKGELLALGAVEAGSFHPRKVFVFSQD